HHDHLSQTQLAVLVCGRIDRDAGVVRWELWAGGLDSHASEPQLERVHQARLLAGWVARLTEIYHRVFANRLSHHRTPGRIKGFSASYIELRSRLGVRKEIRRKVVLSVDNVLRRLGLRVDRGPKRYRNGMLFGS